jgi:signal transduction histidine kinase
VKGRGIVRHAAHLASSFTAMAIALTAAFYFTAFVYRRIGAQPHPLVALILNALLGIFLLIATVAAIRWRFRTKRPDVFAALTAALDRIATGDFTARIENFYGDRGPFRQLAQSVNQTAERLDQLERMRREFVSDVSHEIQSPLTSIRGFASALRQENLSDRDRRHYLDIIEAESLRLSRLSANLLKLASLDSEQARPAPKRYRLDTQIRDVILACETQWAGKRLEMDVELDQLEVNGDEDLLSQVWSNLIHNSIKFTPDGGSVRVNLERREDRVEFRIADTGIGIAPEDQPRIFERFYKADRSRQSSGGGNGLGLAIAKRVVELHGGAIVVRSEPGGGSEFVVALPAGRSTAPV